MHIRDSASWLRKQPHTWWSIDCDYRFAIRLWCPHPGERLADEIDAIWLPTEELKVEISVISADSSAKTDELFVQESDASGRQLIAEGGDDQDGWLLIEQTARVEEANRQLEAAFSDHP